MGPLPALVLLLVAADAATIRTPRLVVEVRPEVTSDARALADAADARYAEAAERLGLALPDGGDVPRLVYFGSHEAKALEEGSIADVSIADDGSRAAAVVEDGVARADGRAESLLLLRRAFGPPSRAALEVGATLVLADEETRAHWSAAAAWVEAAGEATPIGGLLDDARFADRSRLVNDPLAAVLVGVLLVFYGADGLAAAWRGEAIDDRRLDAAYRARLRALAAEHDGWMERRRNARALHRTEVGARGVCFAHEGYSVHDGYASARADRSLARVRGLGADAVSLTPFGYYRDTRAPELRWLRRTPPPGRRQGAETDEAILVAGRRAKARGLTVMLKPHLWGHGWCGEIEMDSPAEWEAWFAAYGEFLVHHALLAETGDFEWLSIGCELVRTTGETAAWRALARRARRLFAGGLTYAANWGEEMERIGFADALDAVGVDCYFPLADGAAPSDEELRAGATAALDRIAALEGRYRRPVVLTEIGFPARARAWADPHRGRGPEPTTRGDQARCLRAFVEAFARQEPPRVRGFYVWKWPTLERFEERERVDFWPASDAALDALRDGFR
ncbi:MAG: glycoside hydrolase family 113 [Planctomycetota bacterium JB042]